MISDSILFDGPKKQKIEFLEILFESAQKHVKFLKKKFFEEALRVTNWIKNIFKDPQSLKNLF